MDYFIKKNKKKNNYKYFDYIFYIMNTYFIYTQIIIIQYSL